MEDYFSVTVLRASVAFEAELIAMGLYDYSYRHSQLATNGAVSAFDVIKIELPVTDERYPALKSMAEQCGALFAYRTKVTQDDLLSSEWFEVRPVSWFGYPRPKDTWQNATYDNTAWPYCQVCGVGKTQIAPFQFSATRREGKTVSFFHPGWVYDELLTRVAVREALKRAAISGLDYLPVVRAGDKVPFDDIVQLQVRNTAAGGLMNLGDFDSGKCPVCGRTKYAPSARAKKMLAGTFAGCADVCKSSEWYGSGAAANQLIVVSRRFAELVWSNKWRGLKLCPIVLVNDSTGHTECA